MMEQSTGQNLPLDTDSTQGKDLIDAMTHQIQETGRLLVRAHGDSMYPFIRNGEVLLIHPAAAESLRIGDVLFYHRESSFYAHRLIQKKGSSDEGLLLVTHGDSLTYLDAPVSADQLIGKVAAVFRGNKILNLETKNSQRVGFLLSKIGIPYGYLFNLAYTGRSRLMPLLLRFPTYRKYRRRTRHVSLSIRKITRSDLENFISLLSDLSPQVPFEALKEEAETKVRLAEERSEITLLAQRENFLAGYLEYQPVQNEWYIKNLGVRPNQRGLGIGEKLMQDLLDLAPFSEMESVLCCIPAGNLPAQKLFLKLGFSHEKSAAQEESNHVFHEQSAYLFIKKYPYQRDTGKESDV